MISVKRRLLYLLGTLVIFGAVTAYAYFGTFKGKQKEEEQKTAEEKIAAFKAVDVKEVDLRSKGVDFVLIADGEGERKWRVEKPVATVGDKSTIDGIVSQFADMKRKRAFDAQPEDLKNFGLEPPLQTVTFKAGDKTTTYLIGKKNSFDDVVYLQRDGDTKVALVPVAAQTQTDRDLFALRDKRLAIFEDKDVSKIDVAMAGKPGYTLEKKGEDWSFGGQKADKAQVTTLLSSLRFARAKSFAAEHAADLKTYGLDKPDLTVTLTVGAGTVQASFGSVKKDKGETFYAKLAGDVPVLEVQDSLLKKYDLKPADLRDKSVATFDRDQVKKVSLSEAGKELVLEKSGEAVGGWSITAPEQKPAQDARVMNVLYKLGGLKAKEIAFEKVDAAAKKTAGLDTPTHEIKLMKTDGTVLADVALGADKGTQIYVLSQNGARIDLIDKSLLSDVKYGAADYEKAEPVATTGDAAKASPKK